MTIIRCQKCGEEVPDNINKCNACGSMVVKNMAVTDVSDLQSKSSQKETYSNQEVKGEFIGVAKDNYSFRKQSKKTLIIFIAVFLAIWLSIFIGRSFVDSVFDRIERNKIVHKDNTKINSGVVSQTKNKIIFVYKNKAGELKKVVADKESLSEFANEQVLYLENEKVRIRKSIGITMEMENKGAFLDIDERITDYAEWYFSYTTSYKIFGVAISSAVSHTLETSAMPVLDSVSLDVEEYLEKHYKGIVLKPEILDFTLRQNYFTVLDKAHNNYLKSMATLNNKFQSYIAEQTTHYDDIHESQISTEIDWHKQFNKVSMTGYEKGTGGAAVGAGLTYGGATVGKAIGAKVVASGVGKTFIAKMAAPFVGKAVTLAGSAVAGGATGTVVGGPVGAVAGAGVGVLVDYAVNEGVELVNRDTFERDARLAVDSFEKELNINETQSLHDAVDVWFNDSINVISEF